MTARKISIVARGALCFLGITTLLVSGVLWAQDRDLERVRLDPEQEEALVALPTLSEISDSSYDLEKFRIIVEVDDDQVKFEAREKGKRGEPIVHWESKSEETVHLVFNTKSKQFHRLTNKVRVVLSDGADLDTLIEESDATRGKAYPKLGYSILELPVDIHPATFVKSMERTIGVESAYVIVEKLPEIPL